MLHWPCQSTRLSSASAVHRQEIRKYVSSRHKKPRPNQGHMYVCADTPYTRHVCWWADRGRYLKQLVPNHDVVYDQHRHNCRVRNLRELWRKKTRSQTCTDTQIDANRLTYICRCLMSQTQSAQKSIQLHTYELIHSHHPSNT